MSVQGGKREVAAMAWPMAVGMLSFTLMGVVDTLLMGYVGTNAQAGVGLATTFFFFCLIFFRGLLTGPQTLVAAADGAKDENRIKLSSSAGIVMGVCSGLLGVVFLGTLYNPVLHFAVPEEGVIQSASAYLRVRLWGMPFTLLGFGLLAGILGKGDTKTRMWGSLIANGVNIGLDFVLIFGLGPFPRMGEAGAALATVAGSVITVLIFGARYLKMFGMPVMPSREVIISSLKVGLPSGMQGMIGVMAFTVMNLVLAQIGAVHLAASEIVLNIISISFLPGFGIGEAGGILVGRYLGAGRPKTASKALGSARTLTLVVMAACGFLFAVKGEWLVSWFTKDPEVAAIGGMLMAFAAMFQIFDALGTVHTCVLRGAGDTRFTMIVTGVTAWGLTVPCTMGFGLWLGWGAAGAYLGLTLELFALAMITGWRVKGIETGKVGKMDLLLGQNAKQAA